MEIFFEMFTNGLDLVEIVCLACFVITAIIGVAWIIKRESRAKGWFMLFGAIIYSTWLLLTVNKFISGIIIASGVLAALIFNIISWVKLYKFKVKDVFIWLQGYLIAIVIAIIGGIIQEMQPDIPTLYIAQYAAFLASLLVEIGVAIFNKDELLSNTYATTQTSIDNLLDDMTGDEDSVDITWMSD